MRKIKKNTEQHRQWVNELELLCNKEFIPLTFIQKTIKDYYDVEYSVFSDESESIWDKFSPQQMLEWYYAYEISCAPNTHELAKLLLKIPSKKINEDRRTRWSNNLSPDDNGFVQVGIASD